MTATADDAFAVVRAVVEAMGEAGVRMTPEQTDATHRALVGRLWPLLDADGQALMVQEGRDLRLLDGRAILLWDGRYWTGDEDGGGADVG